MTPAPISTSKTMPLPRRTSSESSSTPSSGLNSPTSPMSSGLASAQETTGFLARMRARSPARRHTLASPTTPSAAPTPAPAAITAAKRPSAEHARSSSTVSSPTLGSGPRPRPAKRNSGTTMQCGRHSNDWLFGGFSITEHVRDLLKDGGK